MELNFNRRYELPLLVLCLFFSLGAGQSGSGAIPPGEGLFERMLIDKITDIESSLKELAKKVEDIEKRLSRVEKGLTFRSDGGGAAAAGSGAATGGSGIAGPAASQPPPKKRLKSTVPKEKDIGDGLRIIEVDYHGTGENGDHTFFIGKIENGSEDDISVASFKIEVYGEQGNLLGQESFELKDIKRAWPRKFTLIVYKVDSDLIADYAIKRIK